MEYSLFGTDYLTFSASELKTRIKCAMGIIERIKRVLDLPVCIQRFLFNSCLWNYSMPFNQAFILKKKKAEKKLFTVMVGALKALDFTIGDSYKPLL